MKAFLMCVITVVVVSAAPAHNNHNVRGGLGGHLGYPEMYPGGQNFQQGGFGNSRYPGNMGGYPGGYPGGGMGGYQQGFGNSRYPGNIGGFPGGGGPYYQGAYPGGNMGGFPGNGMAFQQGGPQGGFQRPGY